MLQNGGNGSTCQEPDWAKRHIALLLTFLLRHLGHLFKIGLPFPSCLENPSATDGRQDEHKAQGVPGPCRFLCVSAQLQCCLTALHQLPHRCCFSGVGIGLSFLAVACLSHGRHLLGSIFFCLALNYKQMLLYYSPVFFFYLLAVSMRDVSLFRGICKVAVIGIVVVGTFGVCWLPWFLNGRGTTLQVVHRLFPFDRYAEWVRGQPDVCYRYQSRVCRRSRVGRVNQEDWGNQADSCARCLGGTQDSRPVLHGVSSFGESTLIVTNGFWAQIAPARALLGWGRGCPWWATYHYSCCKKIKTSFGGLLDGTPFFSCQWVRVGVLGQVQDQFRVVSTRAYFAGGNCVRPFCVEYFCHSVRPGRAS